MFRRRQALATLALAGLLVTGGVTSAGATVAAASATPSGSTTVAAHDAAPVTLDGMPRAWTALRNGLPASASGFGFDGERFVGQCVGEGGPGCAASGVQRVAYDFGDLGDPAALTDGSVVAATLSLPVGQDQGCGVPGVRVDVVPAVTPETTWAGTAASWRATGTDLSAAGCGGDRVVEVDVTAAARQAARAGRPLAFGLAGDEDCRGCGRASFGPGATLAVELRPSDTVVALGTRDPETPCVVGDDRPAVRSTTPLLAAELSNDREPFATAMSAVFSLRDLASGDELWRSDPTTPQASGSVHTVRVPAGALQPGGTYAWSAQAVLPSGALSGEEVCELRVDVQGPGETVVTPVEGYPALYLEDQTAGGLFQTGGFRFDVPGSEGVAYVRYSFHGDAMLDRAAPGEVVEFTPGAAGSVVLYTQAVDEAGNVGPRGAYRFVVASPVAQGGTWWFDELAGTTAASSLPADHPLALSGADLWSPGVLGTPDDGALTFDAGTDVATTDDAVVDPAGNVTVAAFVRPASDGGVAPVVAQGSPARTGFALGTVADGSCTSPTGTCWAFSVATGDGSTSATAVSTVAPEPEAWTFVVGMRNATTGTVEIWTCPLSGFGDVTRTGQAAAASLSGGAEGPLTVGGGAWRGSIDGLRVLDSVQDVSKLRRWCSGAR
ncbi:MULTISPECIES: LamG-like jellyroll fold domain-containing protein [unclassified Isoptericola]|uniref:LamG-like jellyroll fold domain-containing protein n=1 Tax=unclassified Isoptericola TaxID=2623355 RepID=UPI003648C8B9